MSIFYTNVYCRGDYIYVRAVENGEQTYQKIKYSPTIWTTQNPLGGECDWHTLDGQQVFPKRFSSIYQCKEFIKNYSGIEGLTIFQPPAFQYQYIADNFKGELSFDSSAIKVFVIDIETDVGHRNFTTNEKIELFHKDSGEKVYQTIVDFEKNFDTYQYKVFDIIKKRLIEYNQSCYAFKGGFPDPTDVLEQINLITISDINGQKFTTFSTIPYSGKNPNINYHFYETESAMLRAFLNWWTMNYPDVITGWNNSLFDNTYLYNRLATLLGSNTADKLSPWGFTRQSEVLIGGRKAIKTFFAGIASLDYLDLYKKFGAYNAKESYSLEAIAQEELGVGKLKFDGVDGTYRLYLGAEAVNTKKIENKPVEQLADFERWCLIRDRIQKEIEVCENRNTVLTVFQHKNTLEGFEQLNLKSFSVKQLQKLYEFADKQANQQCFNAAVEYNVRDVELISKLDEKMKLLDLALTIAYLGKVNYEDVFGPVKLWDVIIYHYLNERRVVIPPLQNNKKAEHFVGGYVKEPLVGKHKWAVSFDVNSMYPHLIMGYNMSPETFVEHKNLGIDPIQQLLNKKIDLTQAKADDVAVAANGACFARDKQGILPIQMQLFYDRRVNYKREMIECKKQLELLKNDKLIKNVETQPNYIAISNKITQLNNLQLAVKILINSCFGASANPHFRYFRQAIAEGITTTGQLAIQWGAKALNNTLNQINKTKDVDYVILIDTDSIVISLETLVENMCQGKTTEQKIAYIEKTCNQFFQQKMENAFEQLADYTNAYQQKIVSKTENIIDVMLAVSKKRYVMSVHNSEGVQYKEPQLKIMGLQMVKSSTPMAIRTKLKQSLDVILRGSQHDVQKFVEQYRGEFNQLSVEQIAFPRGISDVQKYRNDNTIYNKSTPIHVRGALLYNHYLREKNLIQNYKMIHEGDKLRFVYLKTPNPIHEDVIAFIDDIPEEFGLIEFVDYDKMFEKTFLDAMQGILDAVKWSAQVQTTLEEFFG